MPTHKKACRAVYKYSRVTLAQLDLPWNLAPCTFCSVEDTVYGLLFEPHNLVMPASNVSCVVLIIMRHSPMQVLVESARQVGRHIESAHQVDRPCAKKIPPTVESENVHYDRSTTRNNDVCVRLADCSHVLLVSMPFRMPWLTSNFAENGHLTSWMDPHLSKEQMWCPNILLFPQFGACLKSTELRGLLVTGDGYSESTVDCQALDSSLNNTTTETRQLARANFMFEQVLTFETVTKESHKLTSSGDICLQTWSDLFVPNSIDEMHGLLHDLESTNGAQVIYKDT